MIQYTLSVDRVNKRHALPIDPITSTYGDAMKLILITLVGLVVGMMVACSSDPAATSTPSYPQISEDETVDSLKQILEGFDKAIQIDPNDALTYFARGSVYGDLGQH
jgi:Tfp pilus assembly protein PilF